MTAISPTPALQNTDSVVIHRCPNTKTTFLMGELRANILEEALYIFCAFLKGQCPEIFCFGFFHESSSPKPLKIILGVISNFFENSRR
jgi:hypothetical protein